MKLLSGDNVYTCIATAKECRMLDPKETIGIVKNIPGTENF